MAHTKTELNSQRRDWLDRLDPRGRRHKQPITVGVYQLDREEANDWLLRVDEHHQRNLALTRAILYATDMTAGDWIEGAQLIAFDLKGRLTNGQHVLTGFVRSELKKLLVIWVILRDPRAYMAFDHNRKRTARDTLRWHGVERPGEMQSIATALFQYERGHFVDTKYLSARVKFPSDAQVQHTIKMHPGLEKHLWKNPFKGKEISVGGLNAASYILYCISPTRAEKFYESLVEGINLPSRDHPITALRREFMNLGDKERMRTGDTMFRIFKAWNALARGESLASVKPRKNEVFPAPLDPVDLRPVDPEAAGPVM